jgi:hypothetical protein
LLQLDEEEMPHATAEMISEARLLSSQRVRAVET